VSQQQLKNALRNWEASSVGLTWETLTQALLTAAAPFQVLVLHLKLSHLASALVLVPGAQHCMVASPRFLLLLALTCLHLVIGIGNLSYSELPCLNLATSCSELLCLHLVIGFGSQTYLELPCLNLVMSYSELPCLHLVIGSLSHSELPVTALGFLCEQAASSLAVSQARLCT